MSAQARAIPSFRRLLFSELTEYVQYVFKSEQGWEKLIYSIFVTLFMVSCWEQVPQGYINFIIAHYIVVFILIEKNLDFRLSRTTQNFWANRRTDGQTDRRKCESIVDVKFFNQRTMVENGKKHRQNSHLIIHFPTSEGVSEVSERANEWAQWRARAKRAVRSKRTSERCEQTSKRTSEWPSTAVCFLAVLDHSAAV